MSFSNIRPVLLAAGLTLAASACNATGGVPSSVPAANSAGTGSRAAAGIARHTTSILKLLTKDVTIGSTVDPANGDKGPRAVTVVQGSGGKLKKGQLLVCNFEDSSGTAGNGTTIEQFQSNGQLEADDLRFKNSKIEGCDGTAVSGYGEVTYATGFTSKVMAEIKRRRTVEEDLRQTDHATVRRWRRAAAQSLFGGLYLRRQRRHRSGRQLQLRRVRVG